MKTRRGFLVASINSQQGWYWTTSPSNDGVNHCALPEEAGGAGLGLACQVLGCAYTALDDAVSAALALEVSLPLAMH